MRPSGLIEQDRIDDFWRFARAIPEIEIETATIPALSGLSGMEHAEAGALSYAGQRLVDMGLALATKPRILLLDAPLAGLAAAERERIGALVKKMSAEVAGLLVEHDIDRVFRLADHVTVMNEGSVSGWGGRGRALLQACAGDLHRFGRGPSRR
jgi:branched-chain amino acid transport system ATP-binding protein